MAHVGRANIGHHVHFHAGDDSEKIAVREIEIADGFREPQQMRLGQAAIKRRKIAAPAFERGATPVARPGIVGNVVDGAAERVDLEHGVALGARQDAHPVIERAARGAFGRRGGLAHLSTPRLMRSSRKAPAEAMRTAAQHAEERNAGNRGHG